jgi:hypothetical protein
VGVSALLSSRTRIQGSQATTPIIHSSTNCAVQHLVGRRGVGPSMCSPVQTPVDPVLASVLVNLCVSRALHDLERLGVGPPRGGSCAVEYEGGRAVPGRDCRGPLGPLGRRQLRRLHSTLVVPAAAALSRVHLKGGHLGKAATMLRTNAHDAVNLQAPPQHPLRRPSNPHTSSASL